MKNVINYYYQLIVEDIHHHDDQYFFSTNNCNYLFLPYYRNIKELENIYRYFIDNHIYCHEIIPNKDQTLATIINNKPYILLRDYQQNRIININDLLAMEVRINNSNHNNWKQKWCDKLDYYEYQMEQYEKKYPKLYESFSYFDGVTEVAINLLNYLDNSIINQYISHFRIKKNTSLRELYNPLNFMIDTRVRDFAEYFKNKYFFDQNPIIEVNDYLNQSSLSKDESVLFLARLIYPSYYFDLYDEIIKGNEKEEKINLIVNKINEYRLFLSSIYQILCHNYTLPEIEWLQKK